MEKESIENKVIKLKFYIELIVIINLIHPQGLKLFKNYSI